MLVCDLLCRRDGCCRFLRPQARQPPPPSRPLPPPLLPPPPVLRHRHPPPRLPLPPRPSPSRLDFLVAAPWARALQVTPQPLNRGEFGAPAVSITAPRYGNDKPVEGVARAPSMFL